MARTATARKPQLIHPASESRVHRAALELMGPLTADETLDNADVLKAIDSAIARFGVRPILKALEERKTELTDRLVAMVKREGYEDDKGKIAYATDLHTFKVIAGKNVYIGEKELKLAMTAAGITPKVQAKILKVKKETAYEYVGVYRRKASEVEEADE